MRESINPMKKTIPLGPGTASRWSAPGASVNVPGGSRWLIVSMSSRLAIP